MSIKTKILLPVIALVAIFAGAAAYIGIRSQFLHHELAGLSGKALTVAAGSKIARANFVDLGSLLSEVGGMTHFIDPAQIEDRFKTAVQAIETNLNSMEENSLSQEMSETVRNIAGRLDP